jgi:hypothetical protein
MRLVSFYYKNTASCFLALTNVSEETAAFIFGADKDSRFLRSVDNHSRN